MTDIHKSGKVINKCDTNILLTTAYIYTNNKIVKNTEKLRNGVKGTIRSCEFLRIFTNTDAGLF